MGPTNMFWICPAMTDGKPPHFCSGDEAQFLTLLRLQSAGKKNLLTLHCLKWWCFSRIFLRKQLTLVFGTAFKQQVCKKSQTNNTTGKDPKRQWTRKLTAFWCFYLCYGMFLVIEQLFLSKKNKFANFRSWRERRRTSNSQDAFFFSDWRRSKKNKVLRHLFVAHQ